MGTGDEKSKGLICNLFLLHQYSIPVYSSINRTSGLVYVEEVFSNNRSMEKPQTIADFILCVQFPYPHPLYWKTTFLSAVLFSQMKPGMQY